jgi:hypothetical protein
MISHSTLMVDCSRRNTRIYSLTQVYNLNFKDKISTKRGECKCKPRVKNKKIYNK